MARSKSEMDIFRNEKYMDDAVSSALLNLTIAAKHKSNYIWADYKFHNSIDDNDSKPADSKQSLPNSAKKKDGKRTVYFINESKYSSLVNTHNQCESSVKQNICERNLDFESKISEGKQNINANSTEIKKPYKNSFDEDVNQSSSSCDFRNNGSAFDVNENMKSNSHEAKIEINCERNKLSNLEIKQKKFHDRTKNHFSSVISLFPENTYMEKHKHTNRIQSCEKRKDLLETVLLLKVFKDDIIFFDFMFELKDLERIIKRFPKLGEVFPEIDKENKEVEFSADAVKVVFGLLLNLQYDAPDERTSIEVLAAFKSWEINQFRTEFKDEFIKKLDRNNVSLVYKAAAYYGLEEVCDAIKHAFSDKDIFRDDRRCRKRKCHLSLSTYVNPTEFHIPLKTAASTLTDHFDRDIKNEISFKAIAGSFIITGFHILLNLDNERDTDSVYLDIASYIVRKQQNYQEELQTRKPLRSNIAIHLKKNLEVDKGETVEIVVEITIKPYLCFAIQEKDMEMGNKGQFCMNLKSTFKVPKSNDQRFFIGKLLYYPKT